MTVQFGILLALCCAVVTNLAFFLKQRGAVSVARVDPRHPWRSARALFSCRRFAAGMGVAAIAWLLHVAAMALAPLSFVQVILAGGLVLIGVMADRWFGFTVDRRQWSGLALTTLGLVACAVTAPGTRSAHSSFSPGGMIAFQASLCVVGLLLLAGPRAGAVRRDHHHGPMLGAASGLLFGVSDIALKALTGIVGAHGVLGLASPWLGLTLVASFISFFASARSFQIGDAVPVIAVTSACASISSIAGGILVFGDPLPGTVLGISVQFLGIASVLLAAAMMPSLSADATAPAL